MTTHQHWDHVRALRGRRRATGATTYAGADDADALPCRPTCGWPTATSSPSASSSSTSSTCAATRPGSVALSWADPDGGTHLFTGDSLFPGGVGNTKNEGQSFESLYATSTSGSSRRTTTTRGSTRATATTRRSGPSDRTSRSGASAAGERAPGLTAVTGRSSRLASLTR